jgi:hypothetical protein
MLLDLLIVPFLLWRRTRVAAFIVAILFHVMNARMFQIGIFPWLGIAATAMFFPPDWPRRIVNWLGDDRKRKAQKTAAAAPMLPRFSGIALSLIALYAAMQLLVPLRHLLYPGRADWTYEGHRFSWRMKLHDRSARARFYVIDPNSWRESEVPPRVFLSGFQASKMAARPDMILQFAHFLAQKLPSTGPKPVRVHARVLASLNGRERQLLIDQNVDLAAQPRTLAHIPWILPLTQPLPDRRNAPERRSKPTSTDTDEVSAD